MSASFRNSCSSMCARGDLLGRGRQQDVGLADGGEDEGAAVRPHATGGTLARGRRPHESEGGHDDDETARA